MQLSYAFACPHEMPSACAVTNPTIGEADWVGIRSIQQGAQDDASSDLSVHAENKLQLYLIWDSNLKKTMRRRQLFEIAGFLCFMLVLVAWKASVDMHWLLVGGPVGISDL
jgi:hypothetical protein